MKNMNTGKMTGRLLACAVVGMVAALAPLAAEPQETADEGLGPVGTVLSKLEPANGTIDADAKYFIYLRGTPYSDDLIKTERRSHQPSSSGLKEMVLPYAKDKTKFRSARTQVMICCTTNAKEKMLEFCRLYEVPFPVLTDSQLKGVPGFTWNTQGAYITVTDSQGRVLQQGQPEVVPDWKKAIRSRELSQEGNLASKLRRVPFVQGKAPRKMRYVVYLNWNVPALRLSQELREIAARVPEFRKAGLEVILCVSEGKKDEVKALLKQQKIKLATILTEDAQELPGFSDKHGERTVVLADTEGKVIAAGFIARVGVERWLDLISDWEKRQAASASGDQASSD